MSKFARNQVRYALTLELGERVYAHLHRENFLRDPDSL